MDLHGEVLPPPNAPPTRRAPADHLRRSRGFRDLVAVHVQPPGRDVQVHPPSRGTASPIGTEEAWSCIPTSYFASHHVGSAAALPTSPCSMRTWGRTLPERWSFGASS